ncbi:MAG: PLP-dependent aminotransferase family protein, partial [Vicinamibacteria bacterium]
ADLMKSGAFERHLLRMRQEYRRRYEALSASAARHGRGLLTLRPLTTGLHAVADVIGADDEEVCREARARGVEVMPMSFYCIDQRRRPPAGLLLGFASIRTERFDAGMAALAAAIKAARRVRRTH